MVCWQCSIFPDRYQSSIFDDEKLNFRVRNENGWDLLSIVTNNGIINMQSILIIESYQLAHSQLHNSKYSDQALDLLVSVRYMHYCTSTPDLSTTLSTWGLTNLRYEISYLEASFTLRCFQRLSFPYFATQLCIWQYNWCTIGTSTPVLSY